MTPTGAGQGTRKQFVSMKSGLEGRNNEIRQQELNIPNAVSMKSGLEGRNNPGIYRNVKVFDVVSMKSGLEGRNNTSPQKAALARNFTSTCELSAPPGPIKPLC